MDDSGFVKLEATFCDKASRLKQLRLYWTRVGPALLSQTLSPLIHLTGFTLVGNPIGDDGFRQVASSLQQLQHLTVLHLCDIGVTWRSLTELEKVLFSCPRLRNYFVYAEKKSFPPAGENITKVSSLTSFQLIHETEAWRIPYYGYQATYSMVFCNVRSQRLVLKFYD